jgi:hypothetical protein
LPFPEFDESSREAQCCLADYSTANFPSYFRADSTRVPALRTPVG